MYKLSLLGICICVVAGGPINPNPFPTCDSELIIIDCELWAGVCCLSPGHRFQAMLAYTPSVSTPLMNLKYEIELKGLIYPIVEVTLPNSGVVAGVESMFGAELVPNDILEGEVFGFRLGVYHTDNPSLGACGRAEASFNCLP